MRSANAITFALISILAGCVDTTVPNTASGHPEVTIVGAVPSRVKPVIVSEMLDHGFVLQKDSEFELQFGKRTKSVAVALVYGTNIGGLPEHRINFTVAEIDGATRVVASAAIISSPGTAFEHSLEFNQGTYAAELQAILDKVSVKLGSPISGAAEKIVVR